MINELAYRHQVHTHTHHRFLPDLLVHHNSYSSLCDVENSSGAAVVEFMGHTIVNSTMCLAHKGQINCMRLLFIYNNSCVESSCRYLDVDNVSHFVHLKVGREMFGS